MPVSERELQNVPIADEIREAQNKILKTFNSLYDAATDDYHRHVGVRQTFPCFCQGAKIPTTLYVTAYPKKLAGDPNILSIILDFEKPELLQSVDQAGTFKYFVEKVADGDLLNQMAKDADLGDMKGPAVKEESIVDYSISAAYTFLYPGEGQPVPEEKETVINAPGVIVTITRVSLDAFTDSLAQFTNDMVHKSFDKWIDNETYVTDRFEPLLTKSFAGVLMGETKEGRTSTINVTIPMATANKREDLFLNYAYSSSIFNTDAKTTIYLDTRAALLKEIRTTIKNAVQNDPNLEFVNEYANEAGADTNYNTIRWHMK